MSVLIHYGLVVVGAVVLVGLEVLAVVLVGQQQLSKQPFGIGTMSEIPGLSNSASASLIASSCSSSSKRQHWSLINRLPPIHNRQLFLVLLVTKP